MTMTKNERPGFLSRIPLPILGGLIAVALVAVVALAMGIGAALGPKEGEHYQLARGTCSATSMTGTVDMTVTNLTGQAIRLKVAFEYRDLDGRLIDADSARVEIGPHDSVRHSESTIVGRQATLIRSCPIVGVDASWS
jgi:hypothetical protein